MFWFVTRPRAELFLRPTLSSRRASDQPLVVLVYCSVKLNRKKKTFHLVRGRFSRFLRGVQLECVCYNPFEPFFVLPQRLERKRCEHSLSFFTFTSSRRYLCGLRQQKEKLFTIFISSACCCTPCRSDCVNKSFRVIRSAARSSRNERSAVINILNCHLNIARLFCCCVFRGMIFECSSSESVKREEVAAPLLILPPSPTDSLLIYRSFVDGGEKGKAEGEEVVT